MPIPLLSPTRWALALLPLSAPVTPLPPDDVPSPDAVAVIEQLSAEAEALAPTVNSSAARAFLAAVPGLPPLEARTVYRPKQDGRPLSPTQALALPTEEREGFEKREHDALTSYFTFYGSPLAYTRPLELLGEAGLESWEGKRLLDMGYGTLGHLRVLALAGAQATGVDVDPYLTALYSQTNDQGTLGDAGGSVTLVEGRWPSEPIVIEAVGEGYDVFLSKNTLKRGYVHPAQEVDPGMTIDLGVDDAAFLAHLHRILVPGGLALIYNICPPEAPEGEPYVPWADGRSPFSRDALEAAGFEVLAFDRVDNEAARRQGVLLAWGDAAELEAGIFCTYTLFQKLPADDH